MFFIYKKDSIFRHHLKGKNETKRKKMRKNGIKTPNSYLYLYLFNKQNYSTRVAVVKLHVKTSQMEIDREWCWRSVPNAQFLKWNFHWQQIITIYYWHVRNWESAIQHFIYCDLNNVTFSQIKSVHCFNIVFFVTEALEYA